MADEIDMRDTLRGQVFVTRPFLPILGAMVIFLGMLSITHSHVIGEAAHLNRIMIYIGENWSPEYTFFDKCGSVELSKNLTQGYSMLQKVETQSVPMRVASGRISWLTGHCNDAADIWVALVKEHTKHPVPLAWLLSQTDDYTLVSLEQRVILGRFALMQGAWFQDRKDVQPAQIWYNRAFLLFPSWETARVLAGLYTSAGDQAEKIEEIWFTLLKSHDEGTADYWWAQAELGALSADWRSAAVDFEKGALLTQSPYQFFMRAGDSWYSAGADENAISAYMQASQALPGNGRPLMRIGDMEAGRGKDALALSWYSQALEINPSDPAILQVVAQTQYKLGDEKLARKYVLQSLDLSPDHPWSLYLLAQLNADDGKLSLAVDMAQRALSAYPHLSKPAAWLEQSLEWALDERDCPIAQTIFDRAQADQLSAGIVEQFESVCANE